MGVVYLGRDTRLGRAVVIKVLPDAFANDPERLAHFERESRSQKRSARGRQWPPLLHLVPPGIGIGSPGSDERCALTRALYQNRSGVMRS